MKRYMKSPVWYCSRSTIMLGMHISKGTEVSYSCNGHGCGCVGCSNDKHNGRFCNVAAISNGSLGALLLILFWLMLILNALGGFCFFRILFLSGICNIAHMDFYAKLGEFFNHLTHAPGGATRWWHQQYKTVLRRLPGAAILSVWKKVNEIHRQLLLKEIDNWKIFHRQGGTASTCMTCEESSLSG